MVLRDCQDETRIGFLRIPMPHRLSIEIGGTKLQAAVGTFQGEILKIKRRAVPRGATAPEIRKLVVELVRRVESEGEPERVGIGFGGPVDTESGRIVTSFQVPDWDGFPLRDWAEEQFGLPCLIENDTNCGALGEARVGAGAGARVVFYTNIGSGIGGGLVIDGSLYRQPFGAAEIGHTKVWDLETGRYVSAESLCSGWSVERVVRQRTYAGRLSRVLALAGGKAGDITAEHVGRAAAEGDSEAIASVAEAAEKFAIPLCNVIALLNPEKIVVGGGVSLMGEIFFDPLRAAVAREVFPPFAQNYEILPAGLGENVVLVGALLI
jgi:glucokinase